MAANADHTQEHSSNDRRRHNHHQQHFLVVAFGVQSHVNPAQDLAHRLALIDDDASSVHCTLSVPVAAHRRMFPTSSPSTLASPDDEETTDGVISYAPFSDGLDDNDNKVTLVVGEEERARRRRASFESLSALLARLAARGRPVTCVVSAMAMPPAIDAARAHGVPLAVHWNQPATVLAAYYHFFHGYKDLISSHAADSEVSMPGFPRPLRRRSLPSFLVDGDATTSSELTKMVINSFQELFAFIDKEKPCVLVSTFDGLEAAALAAMQPFLQDQVFAIGAMARSAAARIHLFEQDDKKSYMEWLSAWPHKSVVYISFGSILTYSKLQFEEILQGLGECGRPYLWVVRKDGREEEVESYLVDKSIDHHPCCNGMVVGWCDQLDVLSHPSVGCFVTHCGWNSTLEALALGVPMVAVPNWSDQPTTAYLVEEEWRVGARAERDGEGVLVGTELARCVELVMGESDVAVEIRGRTNVFREKMLEEVAAGGPSERSLRSFAKKMVVAGKV